jgi:hypothetical protein
MQWACLVLVPEELALGAQGFPLEEPVQEEQRIQPEVLVPGELVQEAQVFQLGERGALKQGIRELTLGEQALGEQKPGVLVLAELELGELVQEAQVFQLGELGELGALKQNIQEPKPGELVEETQVSQQEEQKTREW